MGHRWKCGMNHGCVRNVTTPPSKLGLRAASFDKRSLHFSGQLSRDHHKTDSKGNSQLPGLLPFSNELGFHERELGVSQASGPPEEVRDKGAAMPLTHMTLTGNSNSRKATFLKKSGLGLQTVKGTAR